LDRWLGEIRAVLDDPDDEAAGEAAGDVTD